MSEQRVSYKTTVSHEIDIFIHREIGDIEDFNEELQAIRGASPSDTINLHLCTPGGDMNTALVLIDAMKRSPAVIKGIIGPQCSSAGTMLALSCDTVDVSKFSCMMIHAASYGLIGKHNEVRKQGAHLEALLEDIFYDIYSGFLSDEEIESCLAGEDFWFRADEIAERMEAFVEYRKSLLDTETEEE